MGMEIWWVLRAVVGWTGSLRGAGRGAARTGRGSAGHRAEARGDDRRAGAARGIGLVEVLVAAGLFAALAAGVAHLFAMSARSLVQVRHRTSSLVFAVDKIEQLRAGGAPWGAPPAAGAAETEFLSAGGRVLGRGAAPCRPAPRTGG